MPFLAVLGHTNIDVQLDVASMPGGGRSSPVTNRRTVHGGTACNIARHANGLRVPTALWSRVGPDFPVAWREDMMREGLTLHFQEGSRTPTCYILTDPTGEQAYCMDQGAMTPPYAVPEAAWQDATWLHVSTGDPASYLPTVLAAKAAGARIGFDPGQEIHFAYNTQSFQDMLDLADVFFCNEVELDMALRFLSYGDPVQLLDHCGAVLVTRGAKGATWYDGSHARNVPAKPVDVVDPTGAGDCLRAGWYAAKHAGLDDQTALEHGVRAGSFAVGHPGPQERIMSRADLGL